ncbi:MAG: DPP IV N-terminal domain-containing protein, partial [Saprospiraceae bacterium]|nr:DPP IV N-terminal domain-containing protein [Saprospiraceae bacterium]
MKLWLSMVLILASSLQPLSAQRKITLEDVWSLGTFSARSVPGFNFQLDGRHYTRLENNQVVQYDLTTGKRTEVIFSASKAGLEGRINGYTFSSDEQKMLIKTQSEPIFRRSTKAFFYVYDRLDESLEPVFTNGKHMHATLNPQGTQVAFVYDNNLYVKDLSSSEVRQLTTDGAYNAIINGSADWVYEEEFGFTQGFAWAPDGQHIGFYRFDEREVKEFTMTNYRDGLYPEYVTFKYPKVGEKNAVVEIHIVEVGSGNTTKVDVGPETNQYIPRITWTPQSELVVFRMNRWQNKLELLLANTTDGSTSVMLSEENKYYIDIHDNLTFIKDGSEFIWTSEQDGWNHIYRYDRDGTLQAQITTGKWDVTRFYGVDQKNGQVYFQAAAKDPLQREVYRIRVDGERMEAIADQNGTNGAQFSSTYDYYVLTHATANRPAKFTVYNRNGA